MKSGAHTPMSRIAAICGVLAVVVLGDAILAGFGSRWGWWHFRQGFSMLRWAGYGAYGLLAVSIVAMWQTRRATRRRGWPWAAFGLVVAIIILANVQMWRTRGAAVPAIHDITTDTEDPPAFVAVAPLRADAPNPIEYQGEEIARQQQEAYPDVQPIHLPTPLAETFERALEAARAMGWEIVDANAESLRIEATATTFWFGFKDDIVIRLRPEDSGTRVDVRSKSRVGRGDVGTNARRILAYAARLTN